MEREITQLKTETAKLESQPQVPHLAAPYFPGTTSDEENRGAPAIPPIWTRYIDSRLKQFCTR